MINPEWYKDDVFLDTWVGDRTTSTKDLYRKAWKRYLQFYDEVRGESPSPEFLIREFKRDLKQDRSTISDTIIRWHRWMVNELENPMTGERGLSYGSAQTNVGAYWKMRSIPTPAHTPPREIRDSLELTTYLEQHPSIEVLTDMENHEGWTNSTDDDCKNV